MTILHPYTEERIIVVYMTVGEMSKKLKSSRLQVTGEREREMFYLTTHSTHFIYGYMASDIWLKTILIMRKESRCRHIGYSYRLAAWVLLYASSHRQDSTYHGLCYTSRGAPAGTRNSSSVGTGKKGAGSKGGPPALAGTREYEQSGCGLRCYIIWNVL